MKTSILRRLAMATVALTAILSAPAMAQLSVDVTGEIDSNVKVAVPSLPAQQDVATPAGTASELGRKIAEVIASDLKGSGLFDPSGPGGLPALAFPEVTNPVYAKWGAYQALVQGFVRTTGGEADITVGCYLYDVALKQELTRQGYVVAPRDWRRAAHKIADQIYARLTGEKPYFDSRVAFVQETGPKSARIKRIGVMDYDGANILWMTDSSSLVLAPKFSPDGRRLLFTSYDSGFPQIQLMDVATVSARPLTRDASTMAFAPTFSPDGRWVAYSREQGGNTDIWLMDVATGAQRALTNSPAIDTSPGFSPDGQRIVFESDRSGSPQLYIMGLDGAEPSRISFGDGRYGTPTWSPKGDLIAFTKQIGERFHIGTMRTDGSSERMLTESFLDEGPTWAPNGRVVMFTRATPGGNGLPRLHSVDITGRNMRPMNLDFAASDPSWGPLMP